VTLPNSDAVSLREHLEALRLADEKLQAERDRRYAEVNVEREKALKIKEEADRNALVLAREIQDFKDEKANNLRSQIEGERGSYVTQSELRSLEDKIATQLKTINEFISQNRGKTGGLQAGWQVLIGIVMAALALYAILK